MAQACKDEDAEISKIQHRTTKQSTAVALWNRRQYTKCGHAIRSSLRDHISFTSRSVLLKRNDMLLGDPHLTRLLLVSFVS